MFSMGFILAPGEKNQQIKNASGSRCVGALPSMWRKTLKSLLLQCNNCSFFKKTRAQAGQGRLGLCDSRLFKVERVD